MHNLITDTTQESFSQDVLLSEKPVLVDFWATWCGPCRRLAPVLETVASQMSDQVRIVKVDVDANQELAAKYNVRGIPALFVFKDGQVTGQKVGGLSHAQLVQFIESQIATN